MSAGTKTRILDAAEKLFSEQGFTATSLRAITAEAGVNLAAINYHFKSKDALVGAVVDRRIGPLNRRRLAMLTELEERAGGGDLRLEDVVDAFVTPVVLDFAGTPFVALLGRMYIEPGDALKQAVGEQLKGMIGRFGAAFLRALPGVSMEEIAWRVHFSVGALAHSLAVRPLLHVISGGLCDIEDFEGTRRRLIDYICAGLRSALPAGNSRP